MTFWYITGGKKGKQIFAMFQLCSVRNLCIVYYNYNNCIVLMAEKSLVVYEKNVQKIISKTVNKTIAQYFSLLWRVWRKKPSL